MNHRLIAFAVLALGFLATPVSAAERIGYVDMARVMSESAAGKRARAEIEGMVKLKQEQISRESQKLKTLQQSLEKEQLTLTAAQKRTKQRDFDKKVQDYQQLAADTQRELGQKNVEHSRKVIVDVRAVIREIAQQEKTAVGAREKRPAGAVRRGWSRPDRQGHQGVRRQVQEIAAGSRGVRATPFRGGAFS